MAGVKGKSGGPRANSGGARAGAGRKKAAPKESANGSAVQVELEPQAPGGALKRSRAKAVPIHLGNQDPGCAHGHRADPRG
jgi:phage terminase small subunit